MALASSVVPAHDCRVLLDLAQQGRRWPPDPDPDHQRGRRHGPAVRRREARHHPGHRERGGAAGLLHGHPLDRGRRPASAACSVSPSTRTSSRTIGSSSTTPATAVTSSSRATRRTPPAPTSTRAPASRSCSSSTAPRRTTTAARWRSARAGTCSSASATAAAAGDPGNDAQEKYEHVPRQDPAHQRERHRGGPVRPLLHPGQQPVRRRDSRARRDLGLRPAESLAHLLRSRHGQAVHRRRRAEPIRGDRPRAGRLRWWPELRLERHGGQALLPAVEVPARRRHAADPRVRARRRQLLDHRRLCLPRQSPTRTSSASTSSPTGAAAGSGPCRSGGTAKTLRANTSVNITSFGESESGELYAVTSAGVVYRVRAT